MTATKAQLLKGTKLTTTLYVPEFETDGCGGDGVDCDGIVEVRGLTDAEASEAQGHELAGQTSRGRAGEKSAEVELDVEKSAKGQMLARRVRVAYGLSTGERWTPAEVGRLHPRGVQRVDDKVKELTGGVAEARTFRGDGSGPGDGSTAPDGGAADGDAG